MKAEDVALKLAEVPPLHSRVHPLLLPLSLRQNRVEDILLDFLRWLRLDDSPRALAGKDKKQQTQEFRGDYLWKKLEVSPKFSLPSGEDKKAQIRHWIASELLIDSRATNRRSTSAVSVIPLHSVVAEHFDPPGQPPAYGRLLCRMLVQKDQGTELLRKLADYFGNDHGDPVARILQDALSTDKSLSTDYRFLAVADEALINGQSHCVQFQDQLTSLLRYSSVVSRQTFVSWLYSLIAFFLATYFLRLALVSKKFAEWLESVFDGESSDWSMSIDDVSFRSLLPYGRRNVSHAALMQRFPGYTSQVVITSHFADALGLEPVIADGLPQLGVRLKTALQHELAGDVFSELVKKFPVSGAGTEWNLELVDKERLVNVAKGSKLSSFIQATRLLNFEDMACRSNNVVEWQFYSNLAKNPNYGFAHRGRTGEVLRYELTDNLLAAFCHCHCAQTGEAATLSTFLTYLEAFGFEFDGDGRELLEQQLVELGMTHGLSDASDAKYLTPPHTLQASSS